MAANITVTFSPALTDPNTFVRIWASGPTSPGRNAPADLYLLVTAHGSGLTPLSSVSFLSVYQAKFGALVSGQKIQVRIDTVNSKGFASAPRWGTVIVT